MDRNFLVLAEAKAETIKREEGSPKPQQHLDPVQNQNVLLAGELAARHLTCRNDGYRDHHHMGGGRDVSNWLNQLFLKHRI